MPAVQFGGSDNTRGLTVEIIVQQESPGEGRGVCLGEVCVCMGVFSERKGFTLSLASPRGW